MLNLKIFVFASVLVAVAVSNDCDLIRVRKRDGSGLTGVCCVRWGAVPRPRAPARKGSLLGLLGGIGPALGINGYVNDSHGRNISGGIGGTLGFGMTGPQDLNARANAPAPAPAPAHNPPPSYAYPPYGHGVWGGPVPIAY